MLASTVPAAPMKGAALPVAICGMPISSVLCGACLLALFLPPNERRCLTRSNLWNVDQ